MSVTIDIHADDFGESVHASQGYSGLFKRWKIEQYQCARKYELL